MANVNSEFDAELRRRDLAFCAFLRAHAQVRSEYELLKPENYARFPANLEAYLDAKNAWIRRTEQLALAWYAATYRS